MSQLKVSSVTDLSGTGSAYAPGHVVQTKYAIYTAQTVFNVANYVELLSIQITPEKTNSLIMLGFSFQISGTGGFRITRNNTKIWGGPEDGHPYMYFESPTNQAGATSSSSRTLASYQLIDAPSSTSSVTYSLQIRPRGTDGTLNIAVNEINQGSNLQSIFYAQEIAQ
jgi:hypothetical protein